MAWERADSRVLCYEFGPASPRLGAPMHRDLKKLLHAAHGESEFVVALFLDVHGFSSFTRMAESSEAAVFLRSVYITILDTYFPNADFFKLTGDGMLIITEHARERRCCRERYDGNSSWARGSLPESLCERSGLDQLPDTREPWYRHSARGGNKVDLWPQDS